MTTARNTSGNENCSMHPVDSLFYVLGRCWITLGPQHIPNSSSLCPICFAQHCPLATDILGQMLAIVFMLGVTTSTLWSLQILELFCDVLIKGTHCKRKKKELGRHTPKLIYLLRNLGCLLFWDLTNHGAPCCVLGTIVKPWWVGVHQGGLVVFTPMMQELWIIKQFCHRKFNKIYKILGKLGALLLGSPWWVEFLGDDFIIFAPKMGKILSFE
jgi:hypothetical protein